MTIAVFFTGAAQRHILQDGNVVTHHRRFPNHNTGRMIEHNTGTDLSRRMNIHAIHHRDLMLKK